MRFSIHIKLLFLTLLLSICIVSGAQFQQNSFSIFNVEKGLPSDFVYKCWQDKEGFLWISTDAGLARFDGKNFQIFHAQDGLPENEIENLIQEENGRIWVQSFTGHLAYYNELGRRFLKPKELDSLFAREGITEIIPLQSGGVLIQARTGSYTMIENKLSFYPLNKSSDFARIFYLSTNGTEFRYRLHEQHKQDPKLRLYRTKGNKIVDSIELKTSANIVSFNPFDSSLYLFKEGSTMMTRMTDFNESLLAVKRIDKLIPQPYDRHNFTNRFVNVYYRYNKANLPLIGINVYDIHSLQLLFPLQINSVAWHLINDRNDNLWVSTHSGLVLFSRRAKILPILNHQYSNTTFYSIARRRNGSLLCGSANGQVIEKDLDNTKIHKVRTKINIEWQRNVIESQNKQFTFSDGGIFKNYTKEIQYKDSSLSSNAVLAINDSTVLFANNSRLFKLNTIAERINFISEANTTVTSLASMDGNKIYLGTNDGIITYNMITNQYYKLNGNNDLLKESIVSLCTTHDSIIWAGLETKGILAIKNDAVITFIIDTSGLKSTNITTIACGKYHEVWAGTLAGVSRIKYEFVEGKVIVRIQNISLRDGLTSTAIHQLLYNNDTMLVATDKGVVCIPDSIPVAEIPIILTRIRINQKDTLLLNSFDLPYYKNSISIDFAGVELNGYFDHAQYSEDGGRSWVDLEENNFRIQFKSGDHTIWLRAVDVNNNKSKGITKLQFNIDKPFYENMWFWLGVASVLFAIALYINTLLTRRKQQQQIDQLLNQQAMDELEIQALKAQMNPHFVFNCLNSIKGFIYDEDFEKADLYLDKFASLLRSTLDFSTKPSISLKSELDYIDTYLTLEKLRFGNKFDYSIACEETINQHDIAIPAMLMQPYVENAIKHGVCNLEDGLGKINIKLYLVEDKLHIEIDDNGVGRQHAETFKQQRRPSHESKGTMLTQRRIELYQINLKIIDKHDIDGNSTGTCIHLIVPIPLHQ